MIKDPILEYLSTISLTHSYLNGPLCDIPVLHRTVTRYTQSANISKVFNTEDNESKIYEKIDFRNSNIRQHFNVNNEIKIRLYILQLRLEIIMSEFILATGTLSRLKDLFATLGVQDEVGALSLIITLRSELLEVEAYLNADLTEENENDNNNVDNKTKGKKNVKLSPFDRLAKVKNVVNTYLDASTDVVIKAVNRNVALSVTSSGVESMRDGIDLYSIQKRKSSIDKNIASIASSIKSDKDNMLIINPTIVANESIEALNDLLKMRPLDVETYLELANVYLSNGKLKESLWCVGEILLVGCSGAWNIWAFRAELCMLLSKTFLENDKNAAKSWLYAAIASFSHAIELCSGFVRAWCGLYVSLQKLYSLNIQVDDVYLKLKSIAINSLDKLSLDKSVPVDEKENIRWILERY